MQSTVSFIFLVELPFSTASKFNFLLFYFLISSEMMLFALISVILFVIFYTLCSRLWRKRPESLSGRHVLITGGSSGIGRACALEAAKLGANVTIFARDKVKLQDVKAEISAAFLNRSEQKVSVISVDIGGNYDDVERAVNQMEEEQGPVDVLLNCAGFAIAAKLEDTSASDIRRLMDVNYMGSCFVTRAVLPSMKSRQWGRIVFTSSQAGLVGVYGYCAYAAAKFALRGLAETLQMEVKPYNIRVTLAMPPDTDTPGFAEEEKTKPLETRMISETSGLFSPETVAQALIRDMLIGKFMSTVGRDGALLRIVCAGMSPVTDATEFLIQIFAMGPLRIFGTGLLFYFDRIVAKCRTERDQKNKAT